MAERWPEEISRITIGKALKRIGFTRKKPMGIEKEMKNREGRFSSISVSMLRRGWFTSMKLESMIQKIIPVDGVHRVYPLVGLSK
ncbi:hypothetical protein ACL6C3_14030 [Capilliphycus salinus ALCB114379]|uniref:hypothetical protein n=1 Tax=Capilliphycus salinus TaxID=2768948 RepID=UPI0039A65966